MPVLVVDDLDHPGLTPYRNLKHHIQAGAEDFVVESSMVIERLLGSSFTVHSLLLTQQRYDNLKELIPANTLVFIATKDLISSLAGYDVHRGCLARAGIPSSQRSLDVHLKHASPRSVLILEGLSDPANVGTIIRNAAAFEVDLVVADPRGASPFSRRAARTSAGYLFSIPTILEDPLAAISLLKNACPSLEILAATPHRDAAALHQLEAPPLRAVLIGNEGHGLSQKAMEAADQWVRIPMAPAVDSLTLPPALLFCSTP